MHSQNSRILKMVGATGFESILTKSQVVDSLNPPTTQAQEIEEVPTTKLEKSGPESGHEKDTNVASLSCTGVAQHPNKIDDFLPSFILSWANLPVANKSAIMVLARVAQDDPLPVLVLRWKFLSPEVKAAILTLGNIF